MRICHCLFDASSPFPGEYGKSLKCHQGSYMNVPITYVAIIAQKNIQSSLIKKESLKLSKILEKIHSNIKLQQTSSVEFHNCHHTKDILMLI